MVKATSSAVRSAEYVMSLETERYNVTDRLIPINVIAMAMKIQAPFLPVTRIRRTDRIAAINCKIVEIPRMRVDKSFYIRNVYLIDYSMFRIVY